MLTAFHQGPQSMIQTSNQAILMVTKRHTKLIMKEKTVHALDKFWASTIYQDLFRAKSELDQQF